MSNRKPKDRQSLTPRDGYSAGKQPQLSHEIQLIIGQRLRKFYEDMVDQGVPDRHAKLLNQLNLQRQDNRRGSNENAGGSKNPDKSARKQSNQ